MLIAVLIVVAIIVAFIMAAYVCNIKLRRVTGPDNASDTSKTQL